MSWRMVVISKSAKLDYQMGYLVVRSEDTVRVHIDEIHTLMIETTAVSLTTALLAELVKRKVKVIFCDEKRNPSSELLPYYGAHDTSAKIRNQMQWNQDVKDSVWTEIVSEKIRKQAELLEFLNLDEANLLYEYINEMEFGDVTNREGHAAKVYFNALFGKDFTRTAENSINAALNYGYTLILSTFNREVVSNGYITQIGLFHDNMFNQFNLASDLMEPFRPLVDSKVISLMPEKFEHSEKMDMLYILQEEVVIAGRRELVNNAIKIYARSVFDALNNSDVSLIKFYSRDEL
ncbi:MAG: type II CRISPR-associated endonuclease Cas1 [Lachnospiraceae bacterium]|nr:type II CRISPR-associated endonuclease Cas1 [Lachnospiraceae bacterium]